MNNTPQSVREAAPLDIIRFVQTVLAITHEQGWSVPADG